LLSDTVAGISAESRTVLVVDDDMVLAALMRPTLETASRAVRVAPTWAEAQALIATIEPLVIVLDLVLPDTDGRNAIIQLRETPATARTPIVVVSGILGDAPHAECLALGANAYVVKPFQPSVLAKAVDDAVRAAASAPPVVSSAAPTTAAVSGAPAPVLLAEDDTVVATLVVERLKRAGMEVVHCVTGTDAVAVIETRAFACAILDIKLPGADGFAVLAAIRGGEVNRSTPVAMLTAMGQEKDVTRGFELGADDYIVKPFSPRELTARVQRLIGRAGAR
jgi:DNA-binding response OmpR family regulator